MHMISQSRRAVRVSALLAVLFSLALLVSTAAPVFAAGPDTEQAHAVNKARPAVVRIITTIPASLIVQFTTTTAPVTFPRSGGTYPLSLSGSGAFISSDGDILTASHVISPPEDESMDDAVFQTAAREIATYVNATFRPSPAYTPLDVYRALLSGNFRSQTTYGTPKSEVYLSTDYTGPLTATALKDLPAWMHASVDTVKAESSYQNKDTAIIHVDLKDTPYLTLGDASKLEAQEELTVIGFPGAADVSEARLPNTVLTPSINRVMISALKETDGKAPLIQIAGNINHGDSGGPALNEKGEIVGIVSFGLQESGSTTFLQSVASAQELVKDKNLDLKTDGTLNKLWQQSFSAYAKHDWKAASEGFASIASKYENFKGYTTYKQKSDAALAGQQIDWTSPTMLIIYGSVGGVVIILTVVIVLVASRRSKKQQLQAQGQPALQPYGQGYGAQLPGAAPYPVYGQQSVDPAQQFPSTPLTGQQPDVQLQQYGATPQTVSVAPQSTPVEAEANPFEVPAQQDVQVEQQPAAAMQTVLAVPQPTPQPVYQAQSGQQPVYQAPQQPVAPYQAAPQQAYQAPTPYQAAQPMAAYPQAQVHNPFEQQQQQAQPVNPFGQPAAPTQMYTSQPVNPFAQPAQPYWNAPAPQAQQAAPVPAPQEMTILPPAHQQIPAPVTPTPPAPALIPAQPVVTPLPEAVEEDLEDLTPTPPQLPTVRPPIPAQRARPATTIDFSDSPYEQPEEARLNTHELESMIQRPRHRIQPPPVRRPTDENENEK